MPRLLHAARRRDAWLPAFIQLVYGAAITCTHMLTRVVHAHTHARMDIHIHKHIHIHMHIHIHTHTDIHIHIHTDTHTHTQTHRCAWLPSCTARVSALGKRGQSGCGSVLLGQQSGPQGFVRVMSRGRCGESRRPS